MTTDQAAELLATYELTGSVSETARRLGIAKSTASVHLKRAGIAVANDPNSKSKNTPFNWAARHGEIELLAADKIVTLLPKATLREANMVYGTADDKRYREQHPESVRGVLIDQSQHVHVDTNAALEALIAAKKLLVRGEPVEGGQDAV